MKKKLLALLLCVAMLLPSVAYAAPLGGINFSASAVKDLVSAAADEAAEEETPVVEEPVVEKNAVSGSAKATALAAPQGNVHNVTRNLWYSTLSAATAAATDNNVIEVYNSFTETTSVKIQKNGLTIRAAAGYNPTIKWTKVDAVPVSGATSYHCVVVYTSVTTSTTFGGSTGTLTFDASLVSDADNKGARARVMMHCGKGTLYLKDGIVLTGGNTGGGDYYSDKTDGLFPAGSGEIVGEVGFGSGLFMRYGTLNMSGGIIKDNYSLWGATAEDRKTSHNYYGGGGGVYLYGTSNGSENTTMIMTGGTITHNAAGSGGGGGILVGYSSKLTMSGGTVSENATRFASGGGIGVRIKSEVKITGGIVKDNFAEGHGGGLFARGDSIPLEITGGVFEGNAAGSYGGGVLFWTVGDDVTNNTVIIGGDVQIKNNTATRGGGVSVGREVLDGVPIGNKAKLIIKGNPVISGNTATTYGGGIDMQSDEFSTAVNTVEISGGTISGNKAKDGAGIYVPGGTVTMTGGTFSGNEAADRGAGIFTGGGTMTITSANFVENKAANLGGGAFVQKGTVILNAGSAFTGNEAENGGAVYVNDGSITMNDGAISENTATSGGGAYVNVGHFTMYGGSIDKNSVPGNGGGLYVTGGDFTMISGSLINNHATGTTSYGGGAYVEGGNVYIGAENCGYDAPDGNHNNTSYNDKAHPEISGNTAQDSGGGLAVQGTGNITMYCGKIYGNDAPNRGRGWNVYMEKGTFTYMDGAMGGNLNEPELVIVGGKLDADTSENEKYITLEYNHCNGNETHEGELSTMTAESTENSTIHLPDGEKYWDAAEGYRFFGWTFFGPNNAHAKKNVRTKLDYKELGAPILVRDDDPTLNGGTNYDGIEDGKIQMYALWAPDTSDISYAAVISNTTVTTEWTNGSGNPATYDFYVESHKVTIRDASKPGYAFRGWYIYQDLNQNANWGYEPVYKNGGTGYADLDFDAMEANGQYLAADGTGYRELEMGTTFFGDITLVADFEPAYTDLIIDKDFPVGADYSIDANQVFVFEISGEAYDPKIDFETMTVMVVGDGDIKIADIPVGEYTVTEKSGWSWRYGTTVSAFDSVTGTNVISDIELKDPDREDYKVTFTNTRTVTEWLNGSAFAQNIFKGKSQ